MELGFFFWLMCGVLSGFVAANKGRSGCAWSAMGVLLGPFGLIMALVMPWDEEHLETEAIASGEFQQCPYCAELIRSQAIKCRYCGSELGEDPEGDLPTEESTPADSD